jgi:hypothetical protein
MFWTLFYNTNKFMADNASIGIITFN